MAQAGIIPTTITKGTAFSSGQYAWLDGQTPPQKTNLAGKTITAKLQGQGLTIPVTVAIAPDQTFSFSLTQAQVDSLGTGQYLFTSNIDGLTTGPFEQFSDRWTVIDPLGATSTQEGVIYTVPNHTFTRFQVLRPTGGATFALADIATIANYGAILVLDTGGSGADKWIRVAMGSGDYHIPNHGLNWDTSPIIYKDPTIPGAITQTRPTTSGQLVCILGFANGPNFINFDPDMNFRAVS